MSGTGNCLFPRNCFSLLLLHFICVLCTCLFECVGMCMSVCAYLHLCFSGVARGQRVGVDSFLPPSGILESNSGPWAQWQMLNHLMGPVTDFMTLRKGRTFLELSELSDSSNYKRHPPSSLQWGKLQFRRNIHNIAIHVNQHLWEYILEIYIINLPE